MRLPIVTSEHQIHEDARAHNEALYAAFLEGEQVQVPVTPETVHAVQLKESGDYRRFWRARGFRIRTKRNAEATVLAVWLERLGNYILEYPATQNRTLARKRDEA